MQMKMLVILVLLGALAQWFGWLLKLPSILLLLIAGFLVGPVTREYWPTSPLLLDPDLLFGEMLLPFVSLSVALILFEGGLSLNFRELKGVGYVVLLLVTLGAAVTWIFVAMASVYLLGLKLEQSILLGAILIVTGPTVVLPLLRHIRPSGAVGFILKWEGIVIDPIGALMAVLAFEIVSQQQYDRAAGHVAWAVVKTLFVGGSLGCLGAGVVVVMLRRYWIPEHLQALVTTALVMGGFLGANQIQAESGLLAVTIMGIVKANQRRVDTSHILEFKETLRVFLLSIVFVLLGARSTLADFVLLGWRPLGFVAVMIFIIRPVAVLLSTAGSSLRWRERLFLMWMAPRGIVAAAVTSVFALEMEKHGYEEAGMLVPTVLWTIVGTVLVYGLTGRWAARRLNLSDSDPQGLLIIGAHRFSRALARSLREYDIRSVLVDTNRAAISAAHMESIPTYFGSILGEEVLNKLDLSGIGRLLACTSNDEVNALAVQRMATIFSQKDLYQLPPKSAGGSPRNLIDPRLQGRLLFNEELTHTEIDRLMQRGAAIKITRLSPTFDYAAFQHEYLDRLYPIGYLTESGRFVIKTVTDKFEPGPGTGIVSLILSSEPPNHVTDSATSPNRNE